MSKPWERCRLVAGLVLGLALGHALASSPVENIRQALALGQVEQADKLLRQEKQRLPQDAELRFLEGVVQAKQGQTDKAIETFLKLVQSHPGIVEAHNNLGVLYAAKGQLEEARQALEAGMYANASYAALHRNLADVQSQLVKQTYAKALQVDSKARTAVAQLSLLANMQSPQPQAQPRTSVASTVVAATPSASPPALTGTETAESPKTASTAKAAKEAQAATKPAATPAKATETEAVRAAVMAWAQAWARKDVSAYLQAYANSFVPPEGMSRSQWETERKLRIVSKKSISVEVRQLKVSTQDKTATAQFQQIYSSDHFTGNSRKTLEMTRQGERWLIVRERVQ